MELALQKPMETYGHSPKELIHIGCKR